MRRSGPKLRFTSIERGARHGGTPACDGAEGALLTTDPGESEDAGHHGDGGGVRLSQPVDRKRAAGHGLKDSHVSNTTIGVMSYVALPYLLKFLWAPFVDRFPLPLLGRRRGWILVTQLLLAVGNSVVRVAESCGRAPSGRGLRRGHRVPLSYPGYRRRCVSHGCLAAQRARTGGGGNQSRISNRGVVCLRRGTSHGRLFRLAPGVSAPGGRDDFVLYRDLARARAACDPTAAALVARDGSDPAAGAVGGTRSRRSARRGAAVQDRRCVRHEAVHALHAGHRLLEDRAGCHREGPVHGGALFGSVLGGI